MRKATCARCGKKEGFRKSHERVKCADGEFFLCIDCSQIAYKMRDAYQDGDTTLSEELERDFLALPKEKNSLLSDWFFDFKQKQQK
jgi:hypothetical protein